MMIIALLKPSNLEICLLCHAILIKFTSKGMVSNDLLFQTNASQTFLFHLNIFCTLARFLCRENGKCNTFVL